MRQECELLAGLFSIVGEADKERKQTLENLELECTKLQKKVCLLSSSLCIWCSFKIIFCLRSICWSILMVKTTSHYTLFDHVLEAKLWTSGYSFIVTDLSL